MLEQIIARYGGELSMVLAVLFAWLLRYTMNENRRREERSLAREDKLMEVNSSLQAILERQGDILEKQNAVIQEQGKKLADLTLVIEGIKKDFSEMSDSMKRLWEAVS